MAENQSSDELGKRILSDMEQDDQWFRSEQARTLGVHVDQLNLLPQSEQRESTGDEDLMDTDFVPDRTNLLVNVEESGDVWTNQTDNQYSTNRIVFQESSVIPMQNASPSIASVRHTSSTDIQSPSRSEPEYYLDYSGDVSLAQMQTTSEGSLSVRHTSTSDIPLVNRLDIDRSRGNFTAMQQTSNVNNLQIDMNQNIHSNLEQRSQATTAIVNQNVDSREIDILPGRVNLADQINLGSNFRRRTDTSRAQTQPTGNLFRESSTREPCAYPRDRGFREIGDVAEEWFRALDEETQTQMRQSGRVSLSVTLWRRFQALRDWSSELEECVNIIQTAQRLASVLDMLFHQQGIDHVPRELANRFVYIKALMHRFSLSI